jgi:hypothetical protein
MHTGRLDPSTVCRCGEAALSRQLHGALGVNVVYGHPGRVLVGAEAAEVGTAQRRAARVGRLGRRVRRLGRRGLARHELLVAHVAHRFHGHEQRRHRHCGEKERQRRRRPGHVVCPSAKVCGCFCVGWLWS